jgi:UDP-N-acetylmuramate--alanine ligase
VTHLVGIGGIGMSAIARLLLARGEQVSGSDVRRTPLIARLEAEGARVFIGHRTLNVEGATRVVVSSAIDPNNPEIVRARELNLPIVARGVMLSELTEGKQTLAVAGTHGKTTTTSMIASVLVAAGLDPTVAIGGEPLDAQSNARLGAGNWFVTESDESDGSFLHLSARIAVVTNVENDHVKDAAEWEAMLGTFERFIAKLPADGLLVAGVDDANTAALARNDRGVPVLTYALHATHAHLRATVRSYEDFGTTSDVTLHGKSLGTLELRVPGEINVKNALAAVAVATHLGIDFDVVAKALGEFRGVRRRFEILLRTPELTIVDDYAHHPTAVRETIATARRYHDGPLVVAFEPHRFTRTKYLAKEFAEALSGADGVTLAPVYAASEPLIPGATSEAIGEPLAARGTPVEYVQNVHQLPEFLEEHVPEKAMVLMLGAGTISEVAHRYARERAEAKVPAR